MGLSSHHGIRGLLNQNIVLENLIIKDFEIAGIILGDGYQIKLKDI